MKTAKKKKNPLWLQNTGTSDVSIGDLGVKVLAGRTIDVFIYNPYLSEEKVKVSMESGSLSKRLASGILRIVEKSPAGRPSALDQIKASKEAAKVTKTRSSVVIESDSSGDTGSTESFDFADYGVNDIITHEQDVGAIVVSAKQDENKQEDLGIKLVPKEEVGQNKQSRIVMDVANEMSKTMIEEDMPTYEVPFIVVKDNLAAPEPVIYKESSDFRVIANDESASEFENTDVDLEITPNTEEGGIVMQIKDIETEVIKQDKKRTIKNKGTRSSKKKS